MLLYGAIRRLHMRAMLSLCPEMRLTRSAAVLMALLRVYARICLRLLPAFFFFFISAVAAAYAIKMPPALRLPFAAFLIAFAAPHAAPL